VSFLGRFVDERFLTHRLRSTSTAGISCAVVALALFEYRLLVTGTRSWDLLLVGVTFVVVKLSLMVWYALKD
jgi:hypothetical protein